VQHFIKRGEQLIADTLALTSFPEVSFRGWLRTLVLLPLVLVVCQATGLLILAKSTQDTEQHVNRISALYSDVVYLETTLLQADVQARSFAVTHNPDNRDAYADLKQTLQYQFLALAADSAGEPILAAHIPGLQRLADTLLSHLDANVRTSTQASPVPASPGADATEIEVFAIAQKRFADDAYVLRSQQLDALGRLWSVSSYVLVGAAAAGLVLTVILVGLAQRHLARRIERVARRAALYTSGTTDTDMPLVEGRDEIARLDAALRTMADTLARREADLRTALLDAEAASRAKSAFVATMSHEIRTPLNGVIGMSELLAESPLSGQQLEYAQMIHSSSESLLVLINDILDFSKLSAGSLELDVRDVFVAPLVRSVVALFAADIKKKSLDVRIAIASDVPAAIVGDELRLRQILLNVFGNAVKFTPAGSIVLSVTASAADGGRVLLTFTVADTGLGIPEAMREQIFAPFQQADTSTTRRFGGTGLGLSISRDLVALMGGTIAVREAPGGGSVFTITVPFERSQATEQPAAPIERQLPPPAVRSGHVLLVEDNETNQRVASRLLQRLGLRPDIAANGREALDALETIHYDLVLMDLQMPVMDGFEATLEVRRRETLSGEHIPIVAMTANALPEDRRACQAAGMDDHVAKPVTLAELRRVIDRWLSS
jgi:signal transduction histidine kinase/CheY-like chemotaxis protein